MVSEQKTGYTGKVSEKKQKSGKDWRYFWKISKNTWWMP